ncbi:alpha-amylase family glycosyl hydrolase [Rufibacter radiotolerans]|uniref:alpha-amylase family glycosyl hydrolase n=1 Tax=Rufibacter radiotolerans TaxID=1379910 RepID=UPI0006645F3B|nr:alpha-amylase family glycosyl hydrolase [Rufibacter radiotolerans]
MKFLYAFSILWLVTMANSFAQQVQLTLRVDMSQQTVSSNGVHVAGTFQSEAGFGSDWNPASTLLTDADNDRIYEVTLTVPAGVYQYKFINGNNWAAQPEQVPAACGQADGASNVNREVAVGASNLRLPVVSFSSCNTQLLFSVDMRQQTVAAGGVYVTGNFQALAGYGTDWSPASVPMADPDGDGIYTVNLSLPAGGLFQYKFINGTTWTGAEVVPDACGLNDGSGNFNRTVSATAAVNTAPVNKFGACGTEGVTVPSIDYSTYWWNDAVFYEIFVRSFYDSNGDGKGDFKGLIQKLDYLNDGDPNTTTDLGITGIWLMPMMESPSYHGYDVTNYYATEPDYGTMAEFEEFLTAAHARGIKVIIDFVMNHSSDQHPWFTQASASTTNTYRNWYVWSDTNPGFLGPWGQGVWHQKNGKYYYGIFYSGMPDLNWSNAQLKSTMWDVTRFWLNKGVDGYRIDAVKYLDEDGTTLENTPETFQLLQEYNQVAKAAKPNAFTVGEAWSATPQVVPYVQNKRLDVCFEFDLATAIINSVKGNNPAALKTQLNTVNRLYPKLQYATFLTNHDHNRVMDELGGNMGQMKQAAALYLTMPGIPFLYYGEEVGMSGTGVDEDKRKPMQWTPASNGGFTTGTPWRALNANVTQLNVQSMAADQGSLLNHYKKLIWVRNAQPALRKGYYQEMSVGNASVLAYARVHAQEAVVVVTNFGADALIAPTVSLPISTLQAGTYAITDLMSGQAVGTVMLNEKGSFTTWSIGNASLAADQTWVWKLTPSNLTAVSQMYDEKIFKVYPNPASGLVQVETTQPVGLVKALTVFDAAGKSHFATTFKGQKYQLNIAGLPSGIYFVKIQTGATSSMQRLVIAH